MLQTQLKTYFSGTGNEPPTSAYPLKCNILPPWIPMLTNHIQVVSKTLERRLINCSWDLRNPTKTCSNQAMLNPRNPRTQMSNKVLTLRGESSEEMYCMPEPSVLSLSLQDTMADGGRRRPERRGANGRGASERERRESERDVVGRGRSISRDPTASVLSKRRRPRVR